MFEPVLKLVRGGGGREFVAKREEVRIDVDVNMIKGVVPRRGVRGGGLLMHAW
jgi:hypothetical protein